MNSFKVGDRVKVVAMNSSYDATLPIGYVFIIENIVRNTGIVDGDNWGQPKHVFYIKTLTGRAAPFHPRCFVQAGIDVKRRTITARLP